MNQPRLWNVLLKASRKGRVPGVRHVLYAVTATNMDIALDSCIRAMIIEDPEVSISEYHAYEVAGNDPVKLWDFEFTLHSKR